MPDPILFQAALKEGRLVLLCGKAVGELRSIVCLYALNGKGKGFHKVIHKEGGGVGAVFFKGFHEAPSGVLVNGGILEEVPANDLAVDEAGRGDELDIHLDTLAWMVHWLIRLRNVLRVRRVDGHDALLFEESVQSRDGTGIAALHKFDPENNKAGIRIAPAHIRDQLNLSGSMLVRVMVRSSGAVAQGFNGAVVASFPAVDVLPVGLVFDSGFGDPVFVSIFNK